MDQLSLGLTVSSPFAPGDEVIPSQSGETRGWDPTLAGVVVHVDQASGYVWVRWAGVNGERRYDMLPIGIHPLGRQAGEWAWETYPELILRRRLSEAETSLLMDRNMPCRDALAWLAESGAASLSEAWAICPEPAWLLWWLEYKALVPDPARLGLSLDLAQACLDRLRASPQHREVQTLLDAARLALAAGVTDWPDLREQATLTLGQSRDLRGPARQLAIVIAAALRNRDEWLVSALAMALALTNDHNVPADTLRQMILARFPSPLPVAGGAPEHAF